MLDRYRPGIEFGHDPARGLFDPYRLGAVNPMTRAAASLRKGTDGWMPFLMSRLPISTGDVTDAAASDDLEALAVALEDSKIVGDGLKHWPKSLVGTAWGPNRFAASMNGLRPSTTS
jgi:hypothetical protein